MNKRLQELLLEAGVYLQARRPYLDEDPTGYLERDEDFMLNNRLAILALLEQGGLEKFAELIVRECANHCDLLLDHKISSEWSRGTHDCSRAIKKHFGVEE